VLFLADDGQRIVGLAGGHCPHEQDEIRHPYSMWVEPELRGIRLAEDLVHRVCDWAACGGASRLELWVTTSNGRAIRFYERLRFQATGRRQPVRPGSNLDELEMTIELQTPREVN
jgi:GNAT superfamily N-acetyltransferase